MQPPLEETMVQAIVVATNGELSAVSVTSLDDMFKKCNFRSQNGFSERTVWKHFSDGRTHSVRLYAKREGKIPNKYVFPSPVENEVYYGKCILINTVGDDLFDLSLKTWADLLEDTQKGDDDVPATVQPIPTYNNELEEEPYTYS